MLTGRDYAFSPGRFQFAWTCRPGDSSEKSSMVEDLHNGSETTCELENPVVAESDVQPLPKTQVPQDRMDMSGTLPTW